MSTPLARARQLLYCRGIMLHAATGLTKVSTEDLKKALGALHRGQLTAPVTIETLTRLGLQHCASELLGVARKLDEEGLRAVLVCVLAERAAR